MKKLYLLILLLYSFHPFTNGQVAFLIGDTIKIYEHCNSTQPEFTLLHSNEKGKDLPPIVFGESNSNYEFYCETKILKKIQSRVFVSINFIGTSPFNQDINEKWISIENIGIAFARDHSVPNCDKWMNIRLYHSPDRNSEFQQICLEVGTYIASVIDIHGAWLKVRCLIENDLFEGWIPKEQQCAEIFSLCMGR